MNKIMLIFLVCFSLSCKAQKNDTIVQNPGSRIDDFKQPSYYTETLDILS